MNRLKLRSIGLGYTLIELLISMAIGLFILAGVVTVMLDGKRNFNHQDELSYLQENARFIKDTLTRDIKMAGYTGCSTPDVSNVNTLKSPAGDEYVLGEAVWGSDSVSGVWTPALGGAWPSIVGIDTNSDILSLGGIFGGGARLSRVMPGTSGVLKVTHPTFAEDGDILFVTDCKQSAIFQTNNITTTAGDNTDSLVRNTGGSIAPGNHTKDLGKAFGTDAAVYKFEMRRYYVADSNISDAPALWRTVNLSTADELISGVDSLQVEYGVDTAVGTGPDDVGDGTVNRYVSASTIIEDEAKNSVLWIGWDRVLSVRINLILRSEGFVYHDNLAVTLDGVNYNDRYMRQRVSFIARIRNRGLDSL